MFDHVKFAYPTRKDAPIFDSFSLEVKAGETVALVGASGSGKSTIVQLLDRFYDPDSGHVLIDGTDLRDINLQWWRSNVSMVSQEPILFSGTVKDNIAFGRSDLSNHDIVAAAKAANAHDFIMKLQNGYDSPVGQEGATLSGGQKQRIAIARAIIKNPKVLLLDEATSALDNESERLVQEALDNLIKNRTTIVIAHRLSTIVNADTIYVMQNGRIIEKGSHSELIKLNGAYSHLVEMQRLAQERGEEQNIDIKQVLADMSDEKAPQSPLARTSEQSRDREVSMSRKREASMASKNVPKREPSTTTLMGTGAEADKSPEAKSKDSKVASVSNRRVFELMSNDWGWIALGLMGACIVGVAMPSWGLIFGNMAEVLFEKDGSKQDEESRNYALIFFGLGCSLCVGWISQTGGFAVAGERLTETLRVKCFSHILRQEMGWWDEEDHNSRILTTRLATDASDVHGGTTDQLGVMLQILATMVTGITIAFVYGWQLALLVLGCMPLLVVSSSLHMKFMMGFASENKKAFEDSSRISGEAVANVKTVVAFAAESHVTSAYSKSLETPLKVGQRGATTAGLSFGFSMLVIYGVYALCFYVGGELVKAGKLSFGDLMKVFFSIVIAAITSGQALQMAPDFQKALQGRNNIFQLLDRVPLIDSTSQEGERVPFPSGEILFEHVTFRYPTRPDQVVLDDFNLRIPAGANVAIVGSSGSGKSTIISLIERFYDVNSGQVLIDGHDIRNVNIQHLREQISLVSQEPRLFDSSIAHNISYGKPNATMEEIVAAAKAANIYDTIMTQFPSHFDTTVGPKGSKLSGGQKQRVAIARALIRNPKILLLDEATSALDSESEKLVQAALEQLMESRSRTIVVIAHRLSTIQRCDLICVLDKGKVAEMGTHEQLMAKNGLYFHLASSHSG